MDNIICLLRYFYPDFFREKFLYDFYQPVLIIGTGNIICNFFDFLLGISHRHTHSGIFQHGNIVKAIPAAHGFLSPPANRLQHPVQRGRLIYILGHNFYKIRLRAADACHIPVLFL